VQRAKWLYLSLYVRNSSLSLTGLIFYGERDTIIMKKVQLPELKKEWERIEEILDLPTLTC